MAFERYLDWYEVKRENDFYPNSRLFMINRAKECTMYTIHHKPTAKYLDTSIISDLIDKKFEQLKLKNS